MCNKTPFCLMPWIHFHVGNSGYVKACCVANINYGNINTQSLDQIWNGESIQKLRALFLRGEADKRCSVCTQIEKAGAKSIRQETFEKFTYSSEFEIINKEKPKYFDIRFSNVCNFACRTCWHGFSSSWFGEAKILKNNSGTKAVIENVNDFDIFISKMGDSIINAQEIYMAGGEPLVMDDHYKLLQWLIDRGATNMLLRYNTNLSVLNYKSTKVLDLWSHFPNIEILASIDAHESLGEYIRKGFDWEVFKSNCLELKKHKHLKLKIAPTVSVLSLRNLPEMFNFLMENDFISANDVYINILERPFHFNIKCLPLAYKQKVRSEFNDFISELQKQATSASLINSIEEIIDYMFAGDLNKYWSKFKQETKKLDSMRNQQIEDYISFVLE